MALLALLAAGETHSEALALALDIPPRTGRWRLAQLRKVGLVVSPTRGTWTLTGAGQRAALAASVPEPAASFAVLDELPAEHRAFLRLIEDAVVSRRALRDVYPSNWPGFVALGPTKSGKTLMGDLVARRFGVDPVDAVRPLQMETPGSLLARRAQTGGDTWTSVASPLLALPLVVFDEFDKAASELRQATFVYLAGTSTYRSEGTLLDVAATTILTLNAERDAARLLPDAYLRRAVVLDTTPLRTVTRDLDETARALARGVLPQVHPDLAPPAAELPDDARRGLRRLLADCLTERGWELVDVEAISRLVLGRWASMPADAEAAVLSVAADYLLVTATRVGLVGSDWPARFEVVVGSAITSIAATLAVARSRQAAHEERQAATARAGLDATLALAGERERLHDALDHALRAAPRGSDLSSSERASIALARGKAPPLRDAIAAARSLAALGELKDRLESDVLVPLGALATVVEARREAAARARVQQRQREADARRQAVLQAKAARRAASAAQRAAMVRHAALQALFRRRTTQPREAVMIALLGAGCLTRESEQYEAETIASKVARSPLGRGLRALRGPDAAPPIPTQLSSATRPAGMWSPRLTPPSAALGSAEPVPVYHMKSRSWYEDRAGRRYQAGELVAWGSPAVNAVLEAAAADEGLPPLTRPAPRRASSRRP